MSNLPTITAEKASEIPLFKSWDDLTTRVITVVIQMPYADPNGKPRAYRLPLCTPTYHEFYSIRGQVPEPNIPRTGIGANGQPVPNPLDNTYLKQKAEAEEERDLRLLIFCLEKAGINVPGE